MPRQTIKNITNHRKMRRLTEASQQTREKFSKIRSNIPTASDTNKFNIISCYIISEATMVPI